MVSSADDAAPSRRAIDRLVRLFRSVAGHDLAGAAALLFATVAALIWANSRWSESYAALVETTATVGIGDFVLSKPLIHWINDGLMGVFFFAVGLEIKREILAGELASLRRALLPVIAAVGGMLLPAVIYLTINWGTESEAGWGIPMATDIAFAIGILTLLGKRIPIGLLVFLTAVAIVDDIGAILVIAVAYTDHVGLLSLLMGAVGLFFASVANRLGVRNPLLYLILGLIVWTAFLESGIHATLAAVLMAFAIPARTRLHGKRLVDRVVEVVDELQDAGLPRSPGLLTRRQHEILGELSETVEHATAPLQRLETLLGPLVKFLVLPVFALANAGVVIQRDVVDVLDSPIVVGTVLGLFAGKQLGITIFAWLSVKLGWADLPRGVSWRHIHGVGVLAGIGFTMSLFVSGLAFADPRAQETAKIGILCGSLLSAVVGLLLLYRATKSVDS